MSVRNLEHLFKPEAVAVIGASNRPRSIGAAVMRNLSEHAAGLWCGCASIYATMPMGEPAAREPPDAHLSIRSWDGRHRLARRDSERQNPSSRLRRCRHGRR